MKTIRVDGKDYVVEHDFGDGRVIVNLDGAHAFADATSMGGEWEWSGEPARDGEEKRVLKELTGPDFVETTETKDDGS